jgi:hypothetical protein
VAWKYDADWGLYDRLKGRTFSNIDMDLGEPGDDMFLGHGWLGPEHSDEGSFRWMSGPVATLVVPLRFPAQYRLEFVAEPVDSAQWGAAERDGHGQWRADGAGRADAGHRAIRRGDSGVGMARQSESDPIRGGPNRLCRVTPDWAPIRGCWLFASTPCA